MPKPTHILIGTDFSSGAEAAMEAGCVQAEAFGVRVTLLHAYSAALDLVDKKGFAEERIEIGQEVHRALAAFKSRYDGRVSELHTEIIAGESPVDVLCEYARSHAVDLIVLGAQGRTGLSPLLIGSTAERVARHAHCSVLLAR